MEYLKCDAQGCDHIETVNEITAEMIGRNCPKCGADLLTQKDFDDFFAFTKPIADLAQAMGLTIRDDGPPPEGATYLALGNHNGTLSVTPNFRRPTDKEGV